MTERAVAAYLHRSGPAIGMFSLGGQVRCCLEGMLSFLPVRIGANLLRAGGRVKERAAPAQRRRRRP